MRFCIYTYLPREGPETYKYNATYNFLHTIVYIPIYLDRGRKLRFIMNWSVIRKYRYLSTSIGDGNIFHYSSFFPANVYIPIYLERGRKHLYLVYSSYNHAFLYRYLSTSIGDGNSLFFPPLPLFEAYRYLSTSRGDSFIRAKDSKSKRKKALMRKQKRNCVNKGGI